MSLNFGRLNALAKSWMRERHAHPNREIGSVYFHGQRVANGILELRHRIIADESHDDILRAAAIFHDIGKGIEPHESSGAALVRGLLRNEIEPEALEEIARLIAVHDDRAPQADRHDVWARILQDADLLDHFGCYDIWIAVLNTSYYDHASIETLDRFYQEQYDDYVNEFRALLNFEPSQIIFDEKVAFARTFARRLRVESAGGYCI